jgi:CopG family nickel-responsive transcriptional regulator
MEKTVRFTVSINAELLEAFDKARKDKAYTNRSKAVRDLIVDFIIGREWEASEAPVMGSLTLLYSHEAHGLLDRLTEIQHKWHENVVSTMHLHIDEHNCMEILALKGLPSEIKVVADSLTSCRGVKHGKLVMSTTGKKIA